MKSIFKGSIYSVFLSISLFSFSLLKIKLLVDRVELFRFPSRRESIEWARTKQKFDPKRQSWIQLNHMTCFPLLARPRNINIFHPKFAKLPFYIFSSFSSLLFPFRYSNLTFSFDVKNRGNSLVWCKFKTGKQKQRDHRTIEIEIRRFPFSLFSAEHFK